MQPWSLDDLGHGPFETMSDWEPLAHSVLNVTLYGRPMEGIPDPEPLEHLVLVMTLDSGLTEGRSRLEPLEHSVLMTMRDNQRRTVNCWRMRF